LSLDNVAEMAEMVRRVKELGASGWHLIWIHKKGRWADPNGSFVPRPCSTSSSARPRMRPRAWACSSTASFRAIGRHGHRQARLKELARARFVGPQEERVTVGDLLDDLVTHLGEQRREGRREARLAPQGSPGVTSTTGGPRQ
jgi:hypothetical protein